MMKRHKPGAAWFMFDDTHGDSHAQMAKLPHGTVYVKITRSELVATRYGKQLTIQPIVGTARNAFKSAMDTIGELVGDADWVAVYMETTNPYAALEIL